MHLKAAHIAVLIGAAMLLAYLPLLVGEHRFLDWDDQANIVRLALVHDGSVPNLLAAWQTKVLGTYEPLATTLKALLIGSFGLQVTPVLWTTLGLHIANTLLVFFLSRRLLAIAAERDGELRDLLRPIAASALTALLFGLSPLRVEVVAWASGQPYALAGLFFLLSLHAYLRYATLATDRRMTRAAWLVASWSSFGLAVLSKSAAIFLPAVLFCFDAYPLRRPLRAGMLLEKLPYLLVGVVLGFAAIDASATGMPPEFALSIPARIAYALHGLLFHLGKSVYPVDLLPAYALTLHDAGQPGDSVLLSSLLAVALCIAVFAAWRRRPAIASAFVWYVAGFAPVSGLIAHNRDAGGADRYTYLPVIGLCLVLCAWLTSRRLLPGDRPMRARTGVVCGAIALTVATFASLTWRQIEHWRDTESLWRYTLRVDPANPTALNNLGYLLLDQERYPEAVETLRVGVHMDPRDWHMLLNLGYSLEQMGRLEETLEVYQHGLEHHGRLPALHHNLAAIYLKLGRRDMARAELTRERELGSGR